jgi:hypothetical protein
MSVVLPILVVFLCVSVGLVIWRRCNAQAQASAMMVEAIEAGATPASQAGGDDNHLPPYQRRGQPEVVLIGPDPNRELVHVQQANMMQQYAPATLNYTLENASSTAIIDYTTSHQGNSAVQGQPNNPFRDTFATQASATVSSSSLQLEGELVEPDLATRGQASTRSSYREIDEEREMLRIQVMMLQRQLDEVRGTDASMAPELPPAYERHLEGAHPSTL